MISSKTWRAFAGGAAIAIAVGIVAGVAITKAVDNDQPTATSPATVTATVISTITAAPAAAGQSPPVGVSNSPRSTIPGDGTFRVGTEVAPGTYYSPSEGGCFWYRLNDLVFGPESFIQVDVAPGPTYVTIEPSDIAFRSQGCATWKRVG